MPNDERGKKRLVAAKKTIESWMLNLRYNGAICLHIGDDGSHDAYFDDLLEFASMSAHAWYSWRTVSLHRQKRHGVGASLNAGQRYAYDQVSTPLTLYMVDDWSLTSPLDLDPWARVLREVTDVGAVRLGPPHPGISGTVEHAGNNEWFLNLCPNEGYVASQRPTLWHSRFFNSLGNWKEDCSSLECEDDMNRRWYEAGNPRIVLALPHPWQHLYTIDVSDVDPKNG